MASSETSLPGSVLFMCAQNAVRSPMAAAIAIAKFPNSVFFSSAGVRDGLYNPFAVEVLAEIDIDISDHEPRAFEDLDDTYFDLIVTLSPVAYAVALDLKRRQSIDVENWAIADATKIQGRRSIILDAYRQVRDDLTARIVARFDRN